MGAKISRRGFLMGAVGLVAYLLLEEYGIAIRKYTLSVPRLPRDFEGFTILQLSDLHSKWFGPGQSYLLKTIKSQQFDLVALTGDLVNKRAPKLEPALTLVEGLKDKPLFFVPGNHEWTSGYQLRGPLTSLGVRLLENTAVKFSRGQSHLWLLGVDDPYLGRDDLDKCLALIDDAQPKVLLAHAPNIFPKAVEAQISLVLVGHTHGGQIRVPFLGALMVPGQGFFPQYDYGLYQEGNTQMIITGGLGESVLPVRVNIRPEIVLVTLTSRKLSA